MKKSKLIILFFLGLILHSCGAFNLGKKTKDEKTKISTTTEISETSKDSLTEVITELNKAINDNLKIAVGEVKTDDKDFNTRCTEILDNMLSKINVQKSSGGNNYKLFYDLEKRILELQLQIAETQNQEKTTETNTEKTDEKSTEESIEETSKTVIKMIPLWIWIVLGIWFLPQILDRLKIFYNPLAGIIGKYNNK